MTTETAKHTPGPWKAIPCLPAANGLGCAQTINDTQGNPVAGVSGASLHRPLGVPEANACLIASAPEIKTQRDMMADALDAIAHADVQPGHAEYLSKSRICDLARAALAAE